MDLSMRVSKFRILTFLLVIVYTTFTDTYVVEDIPQRLKSLNDYSNLAIQICIYTPMTVMLFVLPDNILLQSLFSLFYLITIACQSHEYYREFHLCIFGQLYFSKGCIHPTVFVLFNVSIVAIYGIYTEVIGYALVCSIIFYPVTIVIILTSFKMYWEPFKMINLILLCIENFCYFAFGSNLLHSNDVIASCLGHIIIPINSIGAFIIIFVHLFCLGLHWDFKRIIDLLMDIFVWSPMQIILIIYVLWCEQITQTIVYAACAYFIHGCFRSIWSNCVAHEENQRHPTSKRIWWTSITIKTGLICFPFGAAYLSIYGPAKIASILLMSIGLIPWALLFVLCIFTLVQEIVEAANGRESIFRCRSGLCRPCPFHDRCGWRHCPCACCW